MSEGNHEEFGDFDVNAIHHIIKEYVKCLRKVPAKPDYIKIRDKNLEISVQALNSLCYEAVDHVASLLQIVENNKTKFNIQSPNIEQKDIREASLEAYEPWSD